jgi:hypothetical protein
MRLWDIPDMASTISCGLAAELRQRIDREFTQLNALSEEAASTLPPAGGWSPKEELGHLIDSAVNNHARFVIGAIGPEMRGPGYAQDDWVRFHGYQQLPWNRIVAWWYAHNEILVEVISRLPEDRLASSCYIGKYPAQTLHFVVQDYGVHLQHHVDHLLSRPVVTPYPQA